MELTLFTMTSTEAKMGEEEKEKLEEKGKSTVLQGVSRRQSKGANKFVPPFIVIDDNENSSPAIQKDSKKGEGPNPCSNKGKNPAKNIQDQHIKKTLKKKKIVLFVENGNLMGLGLTFH